MSPEQKVRHSYSRCNPIQIYILMLNNSIYRLGAQHPKNDQKLIHMQEICELLYILHKIPLISSTASIIDA